MHSVLLARLIVLEDSLEGSFLGVRSVLFPFSLGEGHRREAEEPGSEVERRGFSPKKTSSR